MSSAATRRRVLPATSRGRTFASSALAWAAERSFFAPPGISSSSRCVQLGDLAGVLLAELSGAGRPAPAAPSSLVIGHHRTQPGHPGADQGDGVGVGGVGLAALTGREDPYLGPTASAGRRRPPRRRRAAGCAMCRPIPLQPSIAHTRSGRSRPTSRAHRGEPGRVGGEPAATEDRLVGGHHLDRDRPLVRVHPDHDPLLLSCSAIAATS